MSVIETIGMPAHEEGDATVEIERPVVTLRAEGLKKRRCFFPRAWRDWNEIREQEIHRLFFQRPYTESKMKNSNATKAKVRAPYTARATGSLIRSYLLGPVFREMTRQAAAIVDNKMRRVSMIIVI